MIHVSIPVRAHAALLEAMRTHARATPASECCGALLGRDGGDARRLEQVVPLANGAREAHAAYLIDAQAIRRVERRARDAGLQVVGFYHSHPFGPAAPSATDLEAAWPWFTYVIVDRRGDVTAWRLRDDRTGFEAEDIEWLP